MTFVAGSLSITRPTTQTTKQTTLVASGTEYSHTFPANTQNFRLWCNQAIVLKYATIVGDTNVAGNYVEIEGGGGIFASDIQGTPTIYLQSNKPNTVINLQSWA